ncbi:hypothetical protein CVT91_18440 [Candidatus Atribacteria bacterium HGW-Atribacteria-1]|nr:MAG: hypothetical protein CVT91_18440 [Candidatus Atribacteria bacterium HGW-Atribacteria-1]
MFTHKQQRLMRLCKPFLFLSLFTAIGIFLHELGHHLLGIPSMVSLARNWPLVPVTAENKNSVIIGSLAGPTVNLLLGYLGLLVYALSRREGFLKTSGMFCGLANSVLVLIAAIVNLIVDLISGTRVNDLQVVSGLLSINVLILPAIYSILSVPPFKFFWSKRSSISEKKITFILLLLGAWFFGGAFLMLLVSCN